jgi:hypothetical protein
MDSPVLESFDAPTVRPIITRYFKVLLLFVLEMQYFQCFIRRCRGPVGLVQGFNDAEPDPPTCPRRLMTTRTLECPSSDVIYIQYGIAHN